MINPIAVAIMVSNVVLLLLGLLLVLRRRKVIGKAISLVGVGVATVPFLVSFYLAR